MFLRSVKTAILICTALSFFSAVFAEEGEFVDPYIEIEVSLERNIKFFFETVRMRNRALSGGADELKVERKFDPLIEARAKGIAGIFFKPLLRDDQEAAEKLYLVMREKFEKNKQDVFLRPGDVEKLLVAFEVQIDEVHERPDYNKEEWKAAVVVGVVAVIMYDGIWVAFKGIKGLITLALKIIRKIIPTKKDKVVLDEVIQKMEGVPESKVISRWSRLRKMFSPKEWKDWFVSKYGDFRENFSFTDFCKKSLKALGIRAGIFAVVAGPSYWFFFQNFNPWDNAEDVSEDEIESYLKKLKESVDEDENS